MRVNIRLLTVIAVIGTCGFAVAQGWEIVHFSLAVANIGSSEKRVEILNRWTAAAAVASTALQAELKETINISDMKAANRRREVLSSIISIKPVSSGDWLSLSGMQFVTDQPMDRVLGSLKLSILTGPNEGYLMAGRGVFGISIWDSLPPDLKTRVAIDLVAGDMSGNEKIREALSAESERVRNEIKEALLASGLSPKKIKQLWRF